MLAGVPTLTIPVAAYNLMALTGDEHHSGRIYGRLADRSASIGLASGAAVSLSMSDLILALAIGALFVDVVRWVTDARISVFDQGLSTLLFLVCVFELLMLTPFGTPTFMLITLMTLLNVAAGMICALAGNGRIGHSFRSKS